ncbi:hypothetical protein CR513_05928, partial [Mucuna pruriens]
MCNPGAEWVSAPFYTNWLTPLRHTFTLRPSPSKHFPFPTEPIFRFAIFVMGKCMPDPCRLHLGRNADSKLDPCADSKSRAKQFDAADLCLFTDIVISPKFELLTFDKYGGTTCPKSYLTMYCRKMALHAHDGALLIYFFQESLTEAALGWYLGLKLECVQTWTSLVESFHDQYKYNMDMAPD